MRKSGQVATIKAGDYQACIVTVGAGLCALTYKGEDLVVPHPWNEIALAHLGKILAPWPNRLLHGHYALNGSEYQLPLNDLSSQSSIHGLVAWKEWKIDELTPHQVTLSCPITPIYGYPFEVRAQACYALDAKDGLKVIIRLKNVGDEVAPTGIGQHPYLCCAKSKADDITLTLPAPEVYTVNELLNPQDLVPVAQLNLDFTKPRKVGATKIDHTFKMQWGPWMASLDDGHLQVTLSSDAPYLQVYTADKLQRIGLALEPMTCPPDAFNSKVGLCLLNPGETQTLSYRISAKFIAQ